ncbi:inhibitor of the pro-sigma K processing machinery [Oikeobacillus pervagus]|uniref:Inhibitor of the pro-sigma K processing machinery n=1 Tax=Oikeobacillus pervagus TaxID=1325931 RepID=A0AAJ1T619_9BACI|nr:pro-sigmaK processing inhibitor BofA family protein [Oikeobacillus pervagus]MDQ0216534.1 inhibitor of the pro-sigma K processing machinery [Oikeobacillus pervagus]
MNLVAAVIVIGILVFILLGVTTKVKPVRFVGNIAIKIVIGALFLFFLNAFGSKFGLHVPINIVTSSVAGILGIPGLAALAIIQTWILV